MVRCNPRQYLIRASFLAISLLFTSLIAAPAVLADVGYTWTDRSSAGARGWTSITSDSTGQYLAAVVYSGDIYTSSNYGASWTDQTSAGSQDWISIASSSTGQYLAAASELGDIYTSSNYGASWTDQTGLGTPSMGEWYSITSDSTGQYLAAVADGGGIYTSSNYGANWTDQTNAGSPRAWQSIASSSNGQYLAAVDAGSGSGGDIYTSSNDGANWTDQTSAGTQKWAAITSDSTGQYLAAAVGNGDIYTSSNYGANWTDQTSAGTQTWSTITSSSNGQYLAAAGFGVGDIWTANDSSLAYTPASTSTTISSDISPVISLTSNGTVNLNATPTGNGVQTIASDTVSVSTNDNAGYTLQLNETNGSTTLTSGSNTIPAVSGTKTTPIAETASSWGYRVDSIGGFGSGPTSAGSNQAIGSLGFAAVPATSSPDTLKTTSAVAANDTTTVWYGIAVNDSIPSGTYTNSVTYTAVAN